MNVWPLEGEVIVIDGGLFEGVAVTVKLTTLELVLPSVSVATTVRVYEQITFGQDGVNEYVRVSEGPGTVTFKVLSPVSFTVI